MIKVTNADNHAIKYSTDIAGKCGLFCGSCTAYPEECGGCLSDRLTESCRICNAGFRACTQEKGVTRCYECGDFPCKRLEDFVPIHVENGISHHEHVIEDLRLMKEIGVQSWVDKQALEHACDKCGGIINWNETNCHICNQ
jgi:hypothetical protein